MARLTVVTFNMQFGQVWREQDPDNAPIDLASTLDFIRSLDADVYLLQEVEHAAQNPAPGDPASNFSALRRALPDFDGFCGHPISAAPQLPFGVGLAILSRTPLQREFNVDLPGPPITFEFNGGQQSPAPRSFIGARTHVDGREVQLFNTHLQAFFMIGGSSDEHPAQRDLVVEHLREAELPTILGGDFNCTPEEATVAQFETTGFSSAQKETPTWHRRPYVCDHLFANKPLHLVSVEVVPTGTSDHMPVRAVFEF